MPARQVQLAATALAVGWAVSETLSSICISMLWKQGMDLVWDRTASPWRASGPGGADVCGREAGAASGGLRLPLRHLGEGSVHRGRGRLGVAPAAVVP